MKPTFHSISINKEDINQPETTGKPDNTSKDIRIQIGKADIYIPSDDEISIFNIIKELIKLC